jgi:hypothetical protein
MTLSAQRKITFRRVKMKKIFCSLVIAMAITTAVSAQIIGDKYNLSAVPTTSTEARYSAGRFGSYVDDFIGVNDYDPAVKTFFFLGGFPSGESVNTTDNPGYDLSVGLGKSIGASTLGLYFGGGLLSASGTDNGLEVEYTKATEKATATWDSNIAILFGNPSLGAFRLDLLLNATDTSTSYNGKLRTSTGQSITTALSWGKSLKKNLAAHATLGILWPNYTGSNLDELNDTTKSETYTGGGLALTGGLSAGDLSADITLQLGFADKTIYGKNSVTTDAPFWTFVDIGYAKTLDLGEQFAIGIKPNASIGLRIWDPNITTTVKDATNTDAVAETTFEVRAGFDVGFKFKLKKSFTLYTGASLQIFDWYAWGVSGGDAKAGGGGWKFAGLAFDTTKWTNSSKLGFGLVYAPNANLSVGAGLNTLLDKFVSIDLENMQVSTNNPFGDANNFLTAAGSVFDGMTFDLTLSYQF